MSNAIRKSELEELSPHTDQSTPLQSADTAQSRQRSTYVPAYDGLRALAVAAVILYHSRILSYPGGVFGVDLFYSLSGFLITGLLIQEFQKQGSLSIVGFYGRRARRLYPALVTMVVCYIVLFGMIRPNFTRTVREGVVALIGIVNWTRAYDLRIAKDLAHLWSLSIEIQFCLLWAPFCYLVLRRWRTSDALAFSCFALTSVLELHRYLLISSGSPGVRLYAGTDIRLAGFAFAAGVRALLDGHSRVARGFQQLIVRYGALLGIGAFVLHLWYASWVSIWEWNFRLSVPIMIALSSALVITSLHIHRESILSRALSLRPLRWLGQISYGLFLWHYPILRLVPRSSLEVWERAVVVSLLTVIAASLSYYFVELRFLPSRRKMKPTNSP